MSKSEILDIKESQELINQFSIIVRSSQFHDPDNVAVLNVLEKFLPRINSYIEREGLLKIDLIGEFFYLNDSRVKYPMEFLLNFDYLAREFRRREIGTISLTGALSEEEMKTFLRSFISSGYSNTPFEALDAMLEDLMNIRIERLKRVVEEGEVDRRKIVKKTYFNAVSFTKGIMTKLKAGEKVSIKRAKRIVESMVDLILSEDQLLIGMTAIKDYDDYTYHHSVNVSVLSISIGQKIGLHRKSLTELGLVALFHDIGKMNVPREILNKPTAFTEEEWKTIKRHPYWGTLAILKLKGIDRMSIQSAIVAFQHHLNFDMTGYPKIRERVDLDFYTKIVSIADQYDAMTSSRVYQRIPLPPDRALSIMMDRAGREIDPILFKFFVNMVGVYPVGSLVLLDTREMGLVYECNPIHADRPRVMVIVNSEGKKIEGKVIDLTEKDDSGRFKRSIVKTLDPNKYKVNLAEYML